MKPTTVALTVLLLAGCAQPDSPGSSSEVGGFLETYNAVDQRLYAVAAEANWKASTDVSEEHTGERIGADRALAAFRGREYVIESRRGFLNPRRPLADLEFRPLDKILP
ncbi:MAG: M2 family metallopeptidase, partial [bacterium]|nr:M2 family metallopeptidase [bacterium]